MSRYRLWLPLLLAVLALTWPAPPPAAAAPPTERLVALVNEQRAAHGLAPLTVNPQLTLAATRYARYMAQANFFSHTGVDGSRMVQRNEAAGYVGWSFLGENLAAGQTTPERVLTGWMNSPGHRANVLAAEAREIGIGHGYSASSRYRNYWAMEIGA